MNSSWTTEVRMSTALPLPKTSEEIEAELRYIDAKLRKFELDQVTKPFSETLRSQGVDRALTGAVQKAWLHANQWLGNRGLPHAEGFSDYVKRNAAHIQDKRDQVAATEWRFGETVARQMYHTIRDVPEDQLRTYKDARRAFRQRHWALTKAHSRALDDDVASAWTKVQGWARFRRRELLSAAVGIGLGIVTTLPTHYHLEHKDHNRTVLFKKYAQEGLHPVLHMGISAHNLEMYLHDAWNRRHDDTIANALAQEWTDFIKPGANPYNKRFTANDAGNDYTRPWADLFEIAKRDTRAFLTPTDAPVQTLATGAYTVDASWVHTSHDTTHTETYDCGTSKHPATCTRIVYDYTDHYWNLNKGQLADGARTVADARTKFPQLPFAKPGKLLDTKSTLAMMITGTKMDDIEAVQAALDVLNRWSKSVVIDKNNFMLQAAYALQASGLPEQVQRDAPTYPASFHNRSYVHFPTDYPRGWNEKQSLLKAVDSIVSPHQRIVNALGEYDKVVPRIERDMEVIGKITSSGSEVRSSLRDLSNLAYDMYNTSYDGQWHPTYGTRILLEWLMFLGIAAGAGFGAYAAMNKLGDKSYDDRFFRFGRLH